MKELWSEYLKMHTELFQENSVIGLFRLAMEKYPDKAAIIDKNGELSYRELEQKSNAVAGALAAMGAVPGEIIAVKTGRYNEAVVACLGIWKAGCAYVFLESDCTTRRNETCLKECDVKIILTRDDVLSICSQNKNDYFEEKGETDRLAVVVYTSGSTGTPKGVKISQKNIVATILNSLYFGMDSEERYACFSSFTFIASIYDVSVAISLGATSLLVPKEIRKKITELAAYYLDNHVTVTFLPPHMAAKYMKLDQNSPLKILLSGSEVVRNLEKRPYTIINIYASSESCAMAVYYHVRDHRTSYPIGKPVHTLRVYVVDEDGNQVEDGQTGELWLSGPQISPGYLNRDDLTRQKFITNPFSKEKDYKKVFCTGDLVRTDEEGQLIYVGRVDNMVKVRGFRIELEGVEKNMREYPGITDACCIAYKDKGGTNILFGYYIADQMIDHKDFREFLMRYMPYYMVPTGLVACEEFPRTETNKVNRRGFIAPAEIDDWKLIAEKYY